MYIRVGCVTDVTDLLYLRDAQAEMGGGGPTRPMGIETQSFQMQINLWLIATPHRRPGEGMVRERFTLESSALRSPSADGDGIANKSFGRVAPMEMETQLSNALEVLRSPASESTSKAQCELASGHPGCVTGRAGHRI